MRKNKIFWGIIVIMLVGAFLRIYHFGDWMHYQLDQSRDFKIIQSAIQYGPGELPLQGPRAAGSFLRLGPWLYYLEYLSALVFGHTPVGSVVIISLLNILLIPLFYLFVRRFFNQKLSLGLSGILASSLFMIVYSRFGWNPNLLPFFILAFFYSLLKFDDDKKEKWLIIAAITLTFVVNMHFIALITIPLIGGIYLLITRPRIKLKWWFLAFTIFITLNIPLIINDIKTGGENSKMFVEAIFAHSDNSKHKHNLIDKSVRDLGAHTEYFWIILTGNQKVGLPELSGRKVICKSACQSGVIAGVISLTVMILGGISLLIFYRREKEQSKKNFLLLNIIWGVIIFGIFIPLAYDIAPRFFLLNATLLIIILGLALKLLIDKFNKNGKILAVLIIGSCILSNLWAVQNYFQELKVASTDSNFKLQYNDRILKEKTRITLGQMDEVSQWVADKFAENHYPVMIYSQSEYERALLQRINTIVSPNKIYDKQSVGFGVKTRTAQAGSKGLKKLYKEANYFVIIRTQSNQDRFLEKYKKKMDILQVKHFGTLTGYYLRPKSEVAIAGQPNISNIDPNNRDRVFGPGIQPRYLWRQIFSGCIYNKKSGICENEKEIKS